MELYYYREGYLKLFDNSIIQKKKFMKRQPLKFKLL